jgi:BirA family biotin operon repressor/biotin-[acetyl-CoA-carboxylase] ligase
LNANLPRDGFPSELAELATSLLIERRVPVDRSELARDLIRRLDHWYDVCLGGGAESLSAAWCEQSEHLRQIVKVETPRAPVVGRLVDLNVRLGVTIELPSFATPEDRLPLIARLPLADIRSIEPFDK